MGRKTVGNDLDNAWIAFHGARVPREALLDRYGEVRPGNGGTYVSKVQVRERLFIMFYPCLILLLKGFLIGKELEIDGNP